MKAKFIPDPNAPLPYIPAGLIYIPPGYDFAGLTIEGIPIFVRLPDSSVELFFAE
jgi:hypothetical protein